MYQFGHVESYAIKPSKGHGIEGIWKEAERVDGYCGHVENPQPPVQVYGCSPREAANRAANWAGQAKDAKGRKLRCDAPCLLAGVLSYPRAGDDWDSFKEASVRWLKGKYGDNLVSVIEHQDEAHPHLHFYAVPAPGQTFDDIHQGRAAAATAKRAGERVCIQRAAHGKAMKVWQDELYQGVSRELGLMRLGPKRLRIPNRREWLSHQTTMREMLNEERRFRDELLERESKLQGKEQEHSTRERSLAGREAALDTRSAKIAADIRGLNDLKGEIDDKFSKLSTQVELERERALAERGRLGVLEAELNEREAKLNEREAEIEAKTPANIKEQNIAFKGLIHAIVARLPEAQLQKLGQTMNRDHRQHLMMVMTSQGRDYNR